MIVTDPSVEGFAKLVVNGVVIVCQVPEGLKGLFVGF